MARRISPEMYPRLLDYLKEDLPKSGMIYFALKLVMKGLMKKKTVWVDSGPGLSCVVVSEEKRQIDCVCRAIIYCKGPGFVRSLDSALKCVSDYLSQKLVLIGCIEEVADALLELIKKEEETSITSLSVIWATTTIVYSFEKKYHLVNMNVPPGITVRCLTSNETEIVCNSWKHRELYADLKERIEEEINTLDSICLFNRKGEPIAWALQKQYGCIGMVHVIPEYRRLGLGSLVISRLVEKILKTEDITYSCVEYQNKASMALHEKVGFRINPRLPKCVFIHVVHDNKK